jgi:hypothetical protein
MREIFGGFFFLIIFNIVFYKKLNIVHILLGLYFAVSFRTYFNGTQEDNKKHVYIRKKIASIISKFKLHSVNSSMMRLTVPKNFRYIFVKSDMLGELIKIHFIKRFSEEIYVRLFILIELFLKIYYNVIIEKYAVTDALDQMKMYYEEIEELKGDIKLNIPIKSKHIKGFSTTLHNVSDSTIDSILHNLKKKINIIDSLK